MYPVLFKIGDFEVRTFGVALVVAFLVALASARRRAAARGLDPGRIVDIGVVMLFAGILGARLLFIAQEWATYSQHPERLLTFRFDGLTSYGGLIGGLVALAIWAKRAQIPMRNLLDVFAVPFLIGSALGRVGCFFNACCYGVPTDPPLGQHFHGLPGTHHPAQLYDMAMLLVGAWWLTRYERTRTLAGGQSIALAFALYGASRFAYEFWRAGTVEQVRQGIASSTYWGSLPITEAQAMALAMVVGGLAASVWLGRRSSTLDPMPRATP